MGRSSTTSSGINLDCASNTTLVTNASPFNSQTALIVEKKKLSALTGVDGGGEGDGGGGGDRAPGPTSPPANHYYAENLRNNHQKVLNGVPIYDPLDRDLEADYKQLDPLLSGEHAKPTPITVPMNSQDSIKPPKDAVVNLERLASAQFQKDAKPSPMRYATQVLAAFAVSLGSLVIGYSSSYTSPALVSMQENATTAFEVNERTGMWIGSIMPLSALFGGIVGGPCIEYLGRRNTILSTAVPFTAAWLLIALAQNVAMILTGRAICGFCVGIASLSLPVYLGETIQTEVRGTLGLLPTAFGNTGILVCFTAGMFLSWRNLALLGACLPIPFLILMFAIPETPRWYIAKGKTKDARKSLQWLRAKNADITDELTNIEKMHVESERNASQSQFLELFKGNNFKPVLISLGLMFFQQLSGINAVIFYTVQIFKDAGSSVDENLSTIIVGLVNFISTFVAAMVIDKLGRKLLLYVSAVSMCLTLFALGTFFYFKTHGADVSSIGWIPLLSLIVYVIGFSLGFGPIPWLMMGEILPVKIRGSAASIATGFNWTCTFVVTKTFQDIRMLIGAHGAFWLFGVIVIIGFVFVVACVPETRGRSLEEIEKGFTGPVRRMSAVANMKPTPMGL